MSPENQWLEDLFPIELVPFMGHVSFRGCIWYTYKTWVSPVCHIHLRAFPQICSDLFRTISHPNGVALALSPRKVFMVKGKGQVVFNSKRGLLVYTTPLQIDILNLNIPQLKRKNHLNQTSIQTSMFRFHVNFLGVPGKQMGLLFLPSLVLLELGLSLLPKGKDNRLPSLNFSGGGSSAY